MIRLIPVALYERLRSRARRFDWQGELPQAGSIPDVLTIAARPRHGEPGWWSAWTVSPFDTRSRLRKWWTGPRPTLPSFAYDLKAEKEIRWRNSLPQRYGLAVREAVVDCGHKWESAALPGIEVLAFSVSKDLCRVFYHVRSGEPDGWTGVSPLLRAGVASEPRAVERTPDRALRAKQLHEAFQTMQAKLAAGLRYQILPEGQVWK
jgi:hypothetical protein